MQVVIHTTSIVINLFFPQTSLLKLSVFLEESSHRSSEDLLQLQEVDDSVNTPALNDTVHILTVNISI